MSWPLSDSPIDGICKVWSAIGFKKKECFLFLGYSRALESYEVIKNEMQKKTKKKERKKKRKICKIPYWKGKMLLCASETEKFLVYADTGGKNTKLYNARKAKDSTGWIWKSNLFQTAFLIHLFKALSVLLNIITPGWIALDTWPEIAAFHFIWLSVLPSTYGAGDLECPSGNACAWQTQKYKWSCRSLGLSRAQFIPQDQRG